MTAADDKVRAELERAANEARNWRGWLSDTEATVVEQFALHCLSFYLSATGRGTESAEDDAALRRLLTTEASRALIEHGDVAANVAERVLPVVKQYAATMEEDLARTKRERDRLLTFVFQRCDKCGLVVGPDGVLEAVVRAVSAIAACPNPDSVDDCHNQMSDLARGALALLGAESPTTSTCDGGGHIWPSGSVPGPCACGRVVASSGSSPSSAVAADGTPTEGDAR